MVPATIASHPDPYVSVTDLCRCWALTRYDIYKQIEAGTLRALRLGPRLYRIRKQDALAFEAMAGLGRPCTE